MRGAVDVNVVPHRRDRQTTIQTITHASGQASGRPFPPVDPGTDGWFLGASKLRARDPSANATVPVRPTPLCWLPTVRRATDRAPGHGRLATRARRTGALTQSQGSAPRGPRFGLRT